MKKRSLVLNVT